METLSLNKDDRDLTRRLLHDALSGVDSSACPGVQRAVEAVLRALAPDGADTGAQPMDGASEEAMPGEPEPPTNSTVSRLSEQVTEAVGRVSALRRSVTCGVVQAMATQVEALRPALRAGELTISTPGKADRRMSMDVDAAPPSAALHISERLLQAADKLPALRARMEEVSKRMSNVLQAIEEQKAFGRMQPTPLRSMTPAKRAAEPDSIVGVIARASYR